MRTVSLSSRRVRTLSAAALTPLLAVFGACSSGDDVATTDDVPTSSSEEGTSTTADEPPDSGSDKADDDKDAGAGNGKGGTTTSPAALDAATTNSQSAPAPNAAMDTAELIGVRVGNHNGYERVVFEFRGELPGYDVGYLEVPPVEDGSGKPVNIGGDAVLAVRMFPASGVRMLEDGIEETYTGPRRIAGAERPITEVVRSGDFEAQLTWMIGVEQRTPFVVSTLESPARIIVDVAAS